MTKHIQEKTKQAFFSSSVSQQWTSSGGRWLFLLRDAVCLALRNDEVLWSYRMGNSKEINLSL